MIYKTFDIALELKQTSTNPTFTVVEGDTGNRLKISVTDGGSPVDLRDCRILAVFSKTNGIAVQDSGGEGNTGIDIGGTYHNEVTVSIFPASIAPGNVECELQIYSGEQSEVLITTARFNFKCNRAVMNGDALQSEEEFPLLVNLIQTVQGFVNDEELRELAELERQAEYQKWANAEAVAETLPHGTPATAEVVEEGGKQVFKFGIPQGEGSGDMRKEVYDKNADGVVDKADNADKLGGKLPSEYASKPTVYPATLELINWSGDNPYTYTLSVPGITAASNGSIRIAQTATDEQWSAFGEAQIRVTGQSANTLTLTATGEAPIINIPVEVVFS